jgi:hypothetical protein
MWSHRSIADSRPGPLCPSAYGALSVARDPSAPAVKGSLRAGHDSTLFPTVSFQQDKILRATGAASVSH